MAPALGPGRSWSARSLGNGGAAIPSKPTPITEHPARLHEPTKNETPTQLACPLRSRYVWSGDSRTPGTGSPAGRQQRSGAGGGLAGRRSVGEQEQKHQAPQRTYSSFEAYVVGGEVLDGETGWTSPSVSAANNTSGGAAPPREQSGGHNNTLDSCNSGAGSALRPGGRANFFFGADYYAALNKARADQAAARLPTGRVDPKAAAVLGVAGSADTGSRGVSVASKAQKLLGVGRREGEEGRGEVLALQDESSPDLSSSGQDSASPRKDEAPPGLDPLEATPRGTMSATRHQQQMGADADVQVAFPPDFDNPRKNGSGSEDGNGSSKARGSGDSLGTKSGSTSLLSMMSGSPRSISTAHDSTGASPRTPLSDHSSTDGGAATAAGSRRGSGTSSSSGGGGGRWGPPSATAAAAAARSAQKDLPAVSVREKDDSDDDMDVPSAHPTPLSAFGGDTDLPSDHPTPGTVRNSSRSRSHSHRSGTDSDPRTPGGSRPVNPSAGTFMQRLKYWGGSNRQDSEASVGAAPAGKQLRRGSAGSGSSGGGLTGAAAATVAKEATSKPVAVAKEPTVNKVATAQSVVPPRKAPVSYAALSERKNGSSRSRSSSRTRKEEGRRPSTANRSARSSGGSGGGSSSSRGRVAERPSGRGPVSAAAPVLEPPPPYSESAASSASGMSPSELRGVPVMPFDSVTSESTSVHNAGPPPAYRPGFPASRGSGDAGGAGAATTTMGPSPPYIADARESTTAGAGSRSRSSSSRNHHQSSSAAEQARSAVPPPPPVASDPVPPSATFGAAHRAELAALRIARGTPAPGDEDVKEEYSDEEEEASDEESEMDWEATSDTEVVKTEVVAEVSPPMPAPAAPVRAAAAAPAVKVASPRPAPRYLMPKAHVKPPSGTQQDMDAPPEQLQQLRQTPTKAPPPPRYMAIVESANVTSALDHSSTSEQDTSPSEDDGGMMAEILTDRLMEVCSKMEQGPATPEDELSDGETAGAAVHKRRPSSRRRQLSNMSNRTLHSNSGQPGDGDDKDVDSDEGSVMDAAAAARRIRRERLRKRSKQQSRRLSSILTVPKDDKGEIIHLHTAAYNGEAAALSSYILQGGDLELRDQFQATALMLCAERGHTEMVDSLLSAGADACCVDENGNSALHLASFYGRTDVVEILLSVDVDVTAVDSEGRTPLDLATDPTIARMIRTEESVRMSGQTFDLLGAVEVNDTLALAEFIGMGQEACGYPHNPNAVTVAAQRLRLDRAGRGGMTAVHLAAFHGYGDALRLLLEAGSDPNAVCDDGETPLHTACTGGSTLCATLLLDHGANPLATDANGLVPCEKHIAGGRQEMKQLLERKAFQATPSNLMSLRADLAEVALQIDAEEDLFVRKGVAIKYLRRALKKKDADIGRLRQAVDARDTDIRNLGDRMESVHRLLKGVSVQ